MRTRGRGEAGWILKGTTIVRWTGRGRLEDLLSGVEKIVRDFSMGARVTRIGRTLVVDGGEPALIASALRYLPGVSWIAVGRSVGSLGELGDAASWLAVRYLRRGARFSVEAETSEGVVRSDVAGAATSAILGKVAGTRLVETRPGTVIRCAFDGGSGAVGVEICRGPGGSPTGLMSATCLVSGGRHSSVTAWFALLAGYKVRLVHAKVDSESLRAVARLYSELSNRCDYSKLGLTVLQGGSPLASLNSELSAEKTEAFGGFHSGCSEIPGPLAAAVQAPLFLAPQEYIDGEFFDLGIRESVGNQDWGEGSKGRASRWTLAGVRADASGVIDGLARKSAQD